MVQETTRTSWGTRLKNALVGLFFGIVLIFGAFFLVFWNEGNGLHTAQSIEQAHQSMISVPNSPIENKNNRRVIYFTGLATTTDILKDSILDISENAIQLDRQVQMYQWNENTETKTEKNMGGSEQEVKTYTYQKIWSSKIIDSAQFKDQVGHENPKTMLLESKKQYAEIVTVGDFELPSELITKIDNVTPISLSTVNTAQLSNKFHKPIQQNGDDLYIGDNAQTPKIGDITIHLSKVIPQNVSVIAQQSGNTVQAYLAPAGKSVILLATGIQSPDKMISDALAENTMMLWILRLVSLLMMIFGIALLMQPLVILSDFIPFLGSIVGFGTGVIAFVVGLSLWTIAIAIAWFTVRPLWAIGLIVIISGICYLVIARKKRQKLSQ